MSASSRMSTRARLARRPSTRQGNGRKAWLLVPFCLACVLAAVFAVLRMNAPPELSKIDGCPTDRVIADSTVVLVDATDGFNAGEVRRLEEYVTRWLAEVPQYGKFTLLLVDAAHPDDPHEVVSRCSPGSGEGLNPAFNTREDHERTWRRTFVDPIGEKLRGLRVAAPSQISPIMQSIAAATWRPDFDASVPRRRLYVASDMLQHVSGGYSHYAGGSLVHGYEGSRLSESLFLDLRQVEVRVLYLHRGKTAVLQRNEHRVFWHNWFRDAGASRVVIDGLGAPAPEAGY